MSDILKIYLDLDGVIFEAQDVEKYHDKDIFSKLPLIEGAREFIDKLKELGEVFVVSKTMFGSDDYRTQKQIVDKTLQCFKLGFNFSHIYILNADQSKAGIVEDGLLIDDYGGNCRVAKLAIQAFEHKKKDWITAKDYGEIIHKIKLVKTALLYKKEVC